MENKIILPLDNVPWEKAYEIMKKTTGLVWGYKIRRSVLEKGLSVIKEIKRFGRVMLDFKLYDIPSAMTESLQLHLDAGADITTVHCTSGYDPASQDMAADHIAGVTVLTSMNRSDFMRYYKGDRIDDMVETMAEEAARRYEYVVCSPRDLVRIRHVPVKKICPGIRPEWYQNQDDQKRTALPREAVRHQADLLVIGRPILTADDPVRALEKTNREIAG